ncbi:MAG: hypothetical protein HY644_00165 [Acidobacteria bacterium]|nr:hypothetical protein [Acidobacteriota bacterium]
MIVDTLPVPRKTPSERYDFASMVYQPNAIVNFYRAVVTSSTKLRETVKTILIGSYVGWRSGSRSVLNLYRTVFGLDNSVGFPQHMRNNLEKILGKFVSRGSLCSFTLLNGLIVRGRIVLARTARATIYCREKGE